MDQILRRDDEALLSVDSDERGDLRRSGIVSLVSHFLEQLDDEGFGEGEAGARVDVGSPGYERAGGEVGGEEGARARGGAGRVDDFDGLDAGEDGERQRSSTRAQSARRRCELGSPCQPLLKSTAKDTDVKGSEQYSENMVTSISMT